MADLDKEKELIRAAMRSQGTYSEDLELSILSCAASLRKQVLAISDVVKLKKTFIIEKSREGNKQYKIHPAFTALSKASEDLRRDLAEVGLTLRTLSASKADEVTDLINDVERADHE